MALFAMGDLHLPLGVNKPMDIFRGWDNYVERIEKAWRENVNAEDTVVIPGDISWAMTLEQSLPDLRFIHSLPGRKIISKGNHDYWWSTLSKINRLLSENCLDSIHILHNNCYEYGTVGICGTRGWVNDNSAPEDAKVTAREAMRLEASINAAKAQGLVPIVFLHYPPIFGTEMNADILDVMFRYEIKQCFYAHLHGNAHEYAINGVRDGIDYRLVSSDYVQFCPYRIL